MRWKIVALSCLAMLAIAGVAKAAGVIGHKDSKLDDIAARTQSLERGLTREGAAGESLARPTRGPRGPKGAKGAKGAKGPAGPQGTFGAITSVASGPSFLCSFQTGSCAVGSAHVECPVGTTLIGGGYTGAGIVTTVTYDAPSGNGWGIVAVNLDEVSVSGLRAVAQCAS